MCCSSTPENGLFSGSRKNTGTSPRLSPSGCFSGIATATLCRNLQTSVGEGAIHWICSAFLVGGAERQPPLPTPTDTSCWNCSFGSGVSRSLVVQNVISTRFHCLLNTRGRNATRSVTRDIDARADHSRKGGMPVTNASDPLLSGKRPRQHVAHPQLQLYF